MIDLKLQSQLGLVTQACNPSTKSKTKGLQIQSQFGLYNRELLPQNLSPLLSLSCVCGVGRATYT